MKPNSPAESYQMMKYLCMSVLSCSHYEFHFSPQSTYEYRFSDPSYNRCRLLVQHSVCQHRDDGESRKISGYNRGIVSDAQHHFDRLGDGEYRWDRHSDLRTRAHRNPAAGDLPIWGCQLACAQADDLRDSPCDDIWIDASASEDASEIDR